MEALRKHWTEDSIADFVFRIASDFVVQLEKKLDCEGISRKELASRLGVSDGRVSQVLNNPGNLTLTSTVQYTRAIQMKVALVAYEDGDPENDTGPINSEIFYNCWKRAGAPRDFFELANCGKMLRYSGAATPVRGRYILDESAGNFSACRLLINASHIESAANFYTPKVKSDA